MDSASDVFPDPTGPNSSTMPPRGRPPMPSAESSAALPVGIAWGEEPFGPGAMRTSFDRMARWRLSSVIER
jgi:hypothetical protein